MTRSIANVRRKHATILRSVRVCAAIASGKLGLIGAKSIDSRHVTIVLQLRVGATLVYSVELLPVSGSLDCLSVVHCGRNHHLASTPWSDQYLTVLVAVETE